MSAPNRQALSQSFLPAKAIAEADSIYIHAWRTPVGPPAAELSVAVIEPGDYAFTSDVNIQREPDGSSHYKIETKWSIPRVDGKLIISTQLPKATLVLLHGILMSKESMMPWALYFAQEGYRVVLVDSRGHGRSTGRWIGFGAWEADDLSMVIDDLERRGLLVGKLGVFGQSYGASMAIHWAARDHRVATVVALAPFADPRKAITEFARGFSPKLTHGLSDATFEVATTKAAKLAGITWADLDVTAAMSRVHVPILIFHGAHDTWIAPLHSETLAASAPPGSRHEVAPDDHISLMFRFDSVGPQVLRWFEQWLLEPLPAGARTDEGLTMSNSR